MRTLSPCLGKQTETELQTLTPTFPILLSGSLQLPDGSTIALPKVATARFGNDPNKRTLCVYGHVDVQPAKLEDGWATEPYNLTDVDGNRS